MLRRLARIGTVELAVLGAVLLLGLALAAATDVASGADPAAERGPGKGPMRAGVPWIEGEAAPRLAGVPWIEGEHAFETASLEAPESGRVTGSTAPPR